MKKLYEVDELLWRETQMRLMQENRYAELDYECLFQMLLEMGISDKRSVEGLGRILIMHLLKLRFQPEKKTRSWFTSVRISRRDLKLLTASGSKTLYNYFVDNLGEIYRLARELALAETGLADELIPKQNPFSVEEILEDHFFAEPV